MDLKQLRAFVTVAETGNVTHAASLLNIVQPAVSRQLRLLEEDMGTELFDRSRHGMRLTPSGETMLEYARRILNEVARAKAEIQPTDGPVSGIVSIGLLASTSDLLATLLADEVARRYPRIRLRLTIGYAGHLQNWLEAGDVDAALLYGQKETPTLHIKALLEEGLWVVAPPSAKLSRKHPLTLSCVAREPFILPAAPQGLRAAIERAANEAGVTLSIFAETNALSVQKDLVARGHGWTILPAVGVTQEVERGLLSAAPLASPGLRRTIVLAAPSSRQATAPVRCVVGVLLECVKTTFEEGRWLDARWLG
ncbi:MULTISPECIES: LysR substrate-binding domain-containing protein [unclassified Caballeronia]|uniref:LysR family transcriptional regulator n=1 Tax=unclassified Caballeronia TaxID=2646786 RepID=UPI00285787BE|nr:MULTISPECIES: LysR substrate-binding domain-containing protein [unclassified Caballeronia]MDR5752405.1 LysR substrate-binding domain-containing protein [Caballeronia sp. LZ024]MDR5845211.1 LysR substrate-binding domain-containing protein [Caballeronia sp. LZ031]